MLISNVNVYGYDESIIASGNPMRTELVNPASTLTEKDLKRAATLAGTPQGSGHDQFLTGVIVQFDLRFSLKAWTEAQRYHFLDFVSSQSTMHCVTKFDIASQCNEYVEPEVIALLERLVAQYHANPTQENYLKVLYNLPAGFELTARMTTNFRQLKTIYHQRKNHRLPEWRRFCAWIETLEGASWWLNQKTLNH